MPPSSLIYELSANAYRVIDEVGVDTPPFEPMNNSKTGRRFENNDVMLLFHWMGGHTVKADWVSAGYLTFPTRSYLNVWVKGVENPYGHKSFACYGDCDRKDRYLGNQPYMVEGQRIALEALRRINVLDYLVEQVFSTRPK